MFFPCVVFCMVMLALPAGAFAALPDQKAAQTTRVFKVPFNLRELAVSHVKEDSPDPFGPAANPPLQGFKTIQEVLQDFGVAFPPGSSATFDEYAGALSLHGTAEMHALVEAILDVGINWHGPPPALAFLLTVVEGPGEVIRQVNAAASRGTDATAELRKLLEQAQASGSPVRVVGDAFVETQSGHRVTTEAVREHALVGEVRLDAQGHAAPSPDKRSVGLALELEPSLHEDGQTVNVTFSLRLHGAPPEDRQISLTDPASGRQAALPVTSLRGTEVTTGITLPLGGTGLVSVTKPSGILQPDTPVAPGKEPEEDVLWAVFVTSKMRRLVLHRPPAPPVPPDLARIPAPSGMRTAAFHAPDGLLEACIDEPRLSLRDWLMTKKIDFPAGARLERHGDILCLTNTPANIERFAAAVFYAETLTQRTAAFTLHTLEAPASLLHRLAREALDSAEAEDGAMLEAVQAAVAQGEAAYVSSSFLQTNSGTRATHQSGTEHQHVVLPLPTIADPNADQKKFQRRIPFVLETRNIGTRFEIDPVIGREGNVASVTFSHELHVGAPEPRRQQVLDPATQKHLDLPVTDFHVLRTTSGSSMRHGGTRLLSLHSPRPQGLGQSDRLWATFLQCHLIPQIIPPRPVPAPAGPAVAEAAPGREKVDGKDLIVRWMKVPPDFLEIYPDFGANSPDPFAPGQGAAQGKEKVPQGGGSDAPPKPTPQEILERSGIQFPEGATAIFVPRTSTLIVRNTRSNLDLVEAFTDSIGGPHFTPTIAFTTHVLEGPGPLLRQLLASATAKMNHRAEMEEALAAVKAGRLRALTTARVETKPGVRATIRQGTEHLSMEDIALDSKGAPVFERKTSLVGLSLEMEPAFQGDRALVSLTLGSEFHMAAPAERQEHVTDPHGRRLDFPLTDYRRASLVTSLTLRDGTAHLLHVWKPTGKPEFEKADVLQVMFLTCDILGPEE